jgi:hypothetical protein
LIGNPLFSQAMRPIGGSQLHFSSLSKGTIERTPLAAGGPAVGLYLPTKLFVFEDGDGAVHVSCDKFVPIMARSAFPILIKWPE